MFTHKPSQEEISKWFAGFKLHDGLKHEQYVGGIVVIENKDRGVSTWMPYVNASAWIAYFWDWVESKKYMAFIEVSDPVPVEIDLPGDKKSRQFYITAEVVVEQEYDHEEPTEVSGITINQKHLRTVRKATGSKQVSPTKVKRGWQGAPDTVMADSDALMKAETGAIARALGSLGMLALPGSGLATAEDMVDFIREAAVAVDERPKTKAAPNPKK